MSVTKRIIAEKAAQIVGADRNASHGDATKNHENIAAIWNGILIAAGKRTVEPLNAHDVANMMEGMKIARRYLGDFNVDDYVDGAGYAAVAGEIQARATEQERHNKEWAAAALEGGFYERTVLPVASTIEHGVFDSCVGSAAVSALDV